MSLKKFTVLFGFIILIMAMTTFVFAEEPVVAPVDTTIVNPDLQTPVKSTNDAQWAWGEVTNLDPQAKTVTLKYLDYETDQEKDLVLTADENTVFENIKSFDEIKIKDTLSIDYIIAADGKNVAKNINFEQPDAAAVAPAQAMEEGKPTDLAPAVEEPAPVAEAVTAPVTETMPVVEAPAPVEEMAPAPAVEAPVSVTPTEPVAEEATPAPVVSEGQAQ
ncbi:MAG: hypothetical protein WC543_02260 [Candidatus Omnitrophota bacterium]